MPIGAKITLRNQKAEQLLERLFKAVNNALPSSKFDSTGNLAFGIKEYIDIPKVEYIPDVGIIGLEVAVTLTRPGYRIKLRRLNKSKIPARHRITREEAMEFIHNKFNVDISEENQDDNK